MKKPVLLTTLVFATSMVHADAETQERAKDHAQPTPNASITTHKTSEETVITSSSRDGTTVNTSKSVSVSNSEQGEPIALQSVESVLPNRGIINPAMDLDQTLYAMREAFSSLQAAQDIAAMDIAADELTGLAGQASILLEQNAEAARIEYPEQTVADLQQLRGLLVELQVALDAGDANLARTKIDVITHTQGVLYEHVE